MHPQSSDGFVRFARRRSLAGSGMTGATDSTRRTYQRIARVYDLVDLPFEYWRYRPIRPLLFEGLSGQVLEAGVGSGRNIPFYPPDVSVVGIDLSPAMLACAQRRASRARVPVELREMDLTALTFPDRAFDAAVASFVLCTLPRALHGAALAELRRVTKPGGLVRLLEYSRPEDLARRAIARLWEPWTRWAFGASFERFSKRALEGAGLQPVRSLSLAGGRLTLIEARAGSA